MTTIHGNADDGFGPLADAFNANFESGAEQGAAVAVYHRGRLVVDLYAGVADAVAGTPWTADTVTVGFSVTKGLMALCGYLAHQRGLLDFDAPVASVWPEFAANGKQDTIIRDLFDHRSGLMALDRDLTLDDVAQWTPVIRAIEAQRPLWAPGTAFAYHALTYGWLTGEVLRRVTGLRPGPLVADYLTARLSARAWIGLPAAEEHKVARMHAAPESNDPPDLEFVKKAMSILPVLRSMTLGGAFPPNMLGDDQTPGLNSPRVHAMEIPAANGILDGRALAAIYAAAVSEIDGSPKLLAEDTIADALKVRSADDPWPGALIGPASRFSTGFMVNGIPTRPLLSDTSFGHDGASGSLGFADADAEVGFGYVNNQMGGISDKRANSLTAALKRCLGV
ncbi:serine hydrolase domain-containing protein [soil metagenome]